MEVVQRPPGGTLLTQMEKSPVPLRKDRYSTGAQLFGVARYVFSSSPRLPIRRSPSPRCSRPSPNPPPAFGGGKGSHSRPALQPSPKSAPTALGRGAENTLLPNRPPGLPPNPPPLRSKGGKGSHSRPTLRSSPEREAFHCERMTPRSVIPPPNRARGVRRSRRIQAAVATATTGTR